MLERYWSWLPQPVRAVFDRAVHALQARLAALRRIGKVFQYADFDGDAALAASMLPIP